MLKITEDESKNVYPQNVFLHVIEAFESLRVGLAC
jgi:hypothetical protein